MQKCNMAEQVRVTTIMGPCCVGQIWDDRWRWRCLPVPDTDSSVSLVKCKPYSNIARETFQQVAVPTRCPPAPARYSFVACLLAWWPAPCVLTSSLPDHRHVVPPDDLLTSRRPCCHPARALVRALSTAPSFLKGLGARGRGRTEKHSF
jgi:hypothetical protein